MIDPCLPRVGKAPIPIGHSSGVRYGNRKPHPFDNDSFFQPVMTPPFGRQD